MLVVQRKHLTPVLCLARACLFAWFCFPFLEPTGYAWGLFLALCSRIIPGGSGGWDWLCAKAHAIPTMPSLWLDFSRYKCWGPVPAPRRLSPR